MKKLLFLKGFILISMISFGQDTTHAFNIITLKQSVELAIANNATVKTAEFTTDNAAVNLNQAKGNLIPQLNGNISHNLNQGRSINTASNTYINQGNTSAQYQLTSNVTLFNGLALMNSLK